MLPVGAALATGLIENAPAVGTLVGQGIASAVDPAAKAYRQQMKTDIKALKQGQLGLSEAEKRTMLAGTQRALQAQTSAAEANLRRSAAAMGGFGRSGAQQAALGQMGAAQQEKLAESLGRIDEQSQRVAEQRFESIMGRLAAKRKEAMETGREVGKVSGEVIKTTAETLAGMKGPAVSGATDAATQAVTGAQAGTNPYYQQQQTNQNMLNMLTKKV